MATDGKGCGWEQSQHGIPSVATGVGVGGKLGAPTSGSVGSGDSWNAGEEVNLNVAKFGNRCGRLMTNRKETAPGCELRRGAPRNGTDGWLYGGAERGEEGGGGGGGRAGGQNGLLRDRPKGESCGQPVGDGVSLMSSVGSGLPGDAGSGGAVGMEVTVHSHATEQSHPQFHPQRKDWVPAGHGVMCRTREAREGGGGGGEREPSDGIAAVGCGEGISSLGSSVALCVGSGVATGVLEAEGAFSSGDAVDTDSSIPPEEGSDSMASGVGVGAGVGCVG